ncbi:Iron-sulfur cluster assembly 2 homolog, mitochondrial [Galdieria sulphuraria]|nr:Iron-sulfur cluster assembly 2 homolog, mitochondrial [Galdieria sulphuraria]
MQQRSSWIYHRIVGQTESANQGGEESLSCTLSEVGEQPLKIDDSCIKRLKFVGNQRGGKPVALRVAVDSGGCSGFQYAFELTEEKAAENETIIEKDGAKIYVDDISLPFLKGSTVAFVEELMSSSFRVLNNPSSEGGCSCGTSFSPKM